MDVTRRLTTRSIEAFLDDLASASPTPGGGSVAALCAALGASLVGMVCRLTVGKPAYAAVQTEMVEHLAEADHLRAQFLELIEADAMAFDRVMEARRLPRETESEKQTRVAAIQAALCLASDVPLKVAELSIYALRLARQVADTGNANVASDAGVAALAAWAALQGAALNVEINLELIKDDSFVERSREQLEVFLYGTNEARDAVMARVRERMAE